MSIGYFHFILSDGSRRVHYYIKQNSSHPQHKGLDSYREAEDLARQHFIQGTVFAAHEVDAIFQARNAQLPSRGTYVVFDGRRWESY